MLKFNVPESIHRAAVVINDYIGIQKGSVTNGEGQLAGLVGHLMCAQWFQDIEKIQVKVARCTSKPKAFYRCNVYKTDPITKPYLVFLRMFDDCTAGYLLGWITKEQFLETATEYKKGDLDPDDDFAFTADCRSVRAFDLKSFPEHIIGDSK